MAPAQRRLARLQRQLRPAPAAASPFRSGGGVAQRPLTAGERRLTEAEYSEYAAGWPASIPAPVYRHVPRFAVGDEAMVDYLDEHGYAVVANALTPREVARALDLIWDFNEGMGTGVDRHDPSTWTNERWVENAADVNGRGTFGLGLSHSEALWYVRGVPRLKDIWATLEGTDDLIVDFSALCQFRPWGIDPAWRTSSGWLHTDRVPGPPLSPPDQDLAGDCGVHTREYVQGLVNLIRTSPATGGNVVLSGSHRHFFEIMERFGDLNAPRGSVNLDLLAAADAMPEVFASAMIAHLEAGDVFLWDDRTIHCNGPGMATEGDTTVQLSRAAVYVTFTPRSKTSAEVLAMRRLMPQRGLFTGHTCRHAVSKGRTLAQMEALPVWQEGDTITVRDTTYNIARPAVLNSYQKSMVG